MRFEPRPLDLLTQGLLWSFRLGALLLAVLLAVLLLALWVFQAITPSGLWELYESIEVWFFDQTNHFEEVKERLIAEFDPPPKST